MQKISKQILLAIIAVVMLLPLNAAAQKLKMVIAVDRAGIVGEDGITHQGVFDVAFLSHIPNVTILSPITFNELKIQLHRAIYELPSVVAIRYPRGLELSVPQNYNDCSEDFATRSRGDWAR